MNYITNIIPLTTNAPNKRRPGYLIPKIEYVTIHNTGNATSVATGERSWLTDINNKVQASFHIAIDQINCIECIPTGLKFIFPNTSPAEVAWHAGDGGSGTGNRKSIGIEMCESGDFHITTLNTIKLVAKILLDLNLGIDRVKQHNNWSGKDCPRILRHTGMWDSFLKDISTELTLLKTPTVLQQAVIPVQESNNIIKLPIADWQRKLGEDAVRALNIAGLLNTPDSWLSKVDENTPNWLFFEMNRRLYDKLTKDIDVLKALIANK